MQRGFSLHRVMIMIISIDLRHARCVAASLLAAIAIAACGSDDSDSGDEQVTVAATTPIVADIARAVAGPDATVEQIVPDGTSPHDFQLTARDRARLEDSDLVIENGAGLEHHIPVDEAGAPSFALADHAGELRPFEAGTEGGEDPHLWMDPTRVAAALPALAQALAEADPEHADDYRRRAEAYAAELAALDSEIERTLAAIPEGDRELVTSHDALGYFADRYGFEVVATPFPASGPEAEPSATNIQEVEDAIEASGVPAVFAEQEDDPEILQQIAEKTGVGVVTGLLVESPGSGGYVEMLRRDAELLKDHLGG